ncbi:T9SS C-terminal target domain-containing protein [bacterium]|nr:MAG: T9SS C-terminal target domain-containing protein [bacterium]
MKKSVAIILLSVSFLLASYEPMLAQTVAKQESSGATRTRVAEVDQVHYSIISNTAITFDWIGTADQIRYGADSSNLSTSVLASHPAFLPVTSPWISDPGPYWEAKLTGLQQNTSYYYRIGSTGQMNKFRTPPPPGTAGFRICTTSDMHDNSPECIAMFAQIAGFKPALVLSTGDLTGAGPDGQQKVVRRFQDAMVWSQSAAWMPVEGNHDWEYTTADDLRTFKGRFDIPNPGTMLFSPAVSAGGEDWGWFDYGNTRFISFPEPWTSSTRIEWKNQVTPVFSAAQNDPNIRFIVTFGHRSSYTSASGRSPGETSMRTVLDGFHTAFPKYVLDLSGHNHQYERYPLSSGMTYIINSTTGSYFRGWDSPTKPSNCAFRAIHYGILVLDFTDDAIQGRFICSPNTTNPGNDYKPREEQVCSTPGTVIDSFTVAAPQIVSAVRGSMTHVPDEFAIANYPNPFNPSTNISYDLPQRGSAKIVIYDVLGRSAATLLDGVTDKGHHTMSWIAKDGNGNDLPSGMYIAQIQTGTMIKSTKMLLVR